MLAAYRSANPHESPMVDQIMSLVTAHTDCFERTCRPGHLTGSAWVVSADGQRHLLLHHRKLAKWLQPGGHADGETDLAAVASREANEETGLAGLEIVTDANGLVPLDVDVHEIPARFGPNGELIEEAHEHHDVRFLLRATEEEKLRGNEESRELRWCLPDEVRTLTQEPSVIRLLEKSDRRLEA